MGFATIVALSALACGSGSRAAQSQSPSPSNVNSRAARRDALAAPATDRALAERDHIVVLVAAKVPASLQVDGRLTEWAIFAGGQPTPLTPSFVAVAATADSVVFAGRVRNVPEQGLSLRLESDSSEFPPIGSLQRGGGIMPLQCDVSNLEAGPVPFDPETCQNLLAEYEQLQKSYAASFVRQLHLTTQALSVRMGEQESSVAAAKYASVADAGALTFEAVLPLSALPRTASAELSGLSVVPERAVSGSPSEAGARQSAAFATPIRFGIDSDLLTCLLQGNNGLPTTPRFSYQPGVPNRIYRTANVGGFAIETQEVPLSNLEGGLGALEVWSVQGGLPMTAIFKAGRALDCVSLGNVVGVVKRGRGLHVIGYNEWQDEAVGLQGAEFKVLEIEADGTLHNDLLVVPEGGFGYTEVGQAYSKDLTNLSISGMHQTDEGGSQQHTLSWRYDARLNHYVLRERKGRYVPPSLPE
jgi:hypothetical protein